MNRSIAPIQLASPLQLATPLALLLAIFAAACSNNKAPAGACTTAPPSGGPAFVASVEFGVAQLNSGADYSVDAIVYPNYGAARISTACPGTQMGSCCFAPNVASCPLPDPVSDGVLTASDGSTQLGQLNFTAGSGYGNLDTFSNSSVTWQAGDSLSISSAGVSGSADPFSSSVVAPADLANLMPAINNTQVTIPRASDFAVSWTAGTGSAQVALELEDVGLNEISCIVPVTTGTVTVPKALLQMFGSAGSLSIEPYNEATVTGTSVAAFVYAYGNSAVGQATYP